MVRFDHGQSLVVTKAPLRVSFAGGGTDIDYVTADVSFRYDVYTVQNLLENETSYEGSRAYPSGEKPPTTDTSGA